MRHRLADATRRSIPNAVSGPALPSSDATATSMPVPHLDHRPRPSSERAGNVSYIEAVDAHGQPVRIARQARSDAWIERLRAVDPKHDALRAHPAARSKANA